MKTLALIFAALFLIQIGSAVTCTGKYFLPTPTSTFCVKCNPQYDSCDGTTGIINARIVGYKDLTAGIPNKYCGNSLYYNKNTNTCEYICKLGCHQQSCIIDYDFCYECDNGFAWNPDYTCLPAVIGLEAASLAILTISLVFLVISCCLVNKARK